MKLVIVESPAKAKTINKYLGKDYEVLASFGHVRDLPSKDGSVDPDDDFAMKWETDAASKKRLTEITKATKAADELILATDPDREGEAISWHVLEVLKQKKALKDTKVSRVVFNAITKKAVLEAMEQPRDLDTPLVDAYLARRALDYLVGFTLSPVLWRKLPGSRSAGRVQSVALRLVCEREEEIEKFKPQEYWSITSTLNQGGKDFETRLYALNGKKTDKLDIATEEQAASIRDAIKAGSLTVKSVEKKPTKRNPYAPFTTSTMQQDASSRLGFAPSRTMQVAQRLYEAGLITYMRTDGVQIAPEAINATRAQIEKDFGSNYLPEKPRLYQSKAKNAQEAHEAIRPTDLSRTPKDAKNLEADQAKLYDLVWKRTMASQMRAAEMERTAADIELNGAKDQITLRAVGSVTTFPGFMSLYGVSTTEKDDENSRELPPLAEGDNPALKKCEIEQHFTQPPARFTEASLIKKMEELGIGRPSTYAATLAVLQNRDYVRLEKRTLIPEDRGRLVTAFLQSFFERYVEYSFTANLEEQLDEISAGEINYKTVLNDFWRDFNAHVTEIKDLRVSEVLDALNALLGDHIFPPKEDGSDPRKCPDCDTGQLSLKVGRYGAFIGCSNYPECNHTRQLGESATGEASGADGTGVIGQHPDYGVDIELKKGRFGPYLEMELDGEKKRSGLPKGWSPESIDLEKAVKLISLPRDVGEHPETGKMITAGLGRYGPFVLHDGTYANLSDIEEVFDVGLNRAVSVLAEKAAKGGRRGAAQTLKELGDHPDGGAVTVKDGRYGPYVNHGKINATLPKDTDPQSVTMEQALELITAKAAKSPAKKKRKATAKKKAPAKKKAAAKS
ncbi:type I DNA topoisomerase [Maritalea mediterranea]|uniref:DNA topoisomerase 1 n=1 Tax=Maritalea mediterranea TaxID=2909667 RepID=A0ABS9EAH5_9HYPH|nr:type I DNA topoisomerase [Maritalea mediterranea]MCF4099889.1 type I DNA topoisomerase [Maritalea mediterranea]